jgi:hypothetical protein
MENIFAIYPNTFFTKYQALPVPGISEPVMKNKPDAGQIIRKGLSGMGGERGSVFSPLPIDGPHGQRLSLEQKYDRYSNLLDGFRVKGWQMARIIIVEEDRATGQMQKDIEVKRNSWNGDGIYWRFGLTPVFLRASNQLEAMAS